MRVAVLGGGLTGVCAALELSARGCEVDLYEQSDEILTQASYWSEGKIHIGFVYAKDASARTARTMIRGALLFRPLLERWIGGAAFDSAVAGTYDYAVHRDSMLPAAAVEQHFDRVAKIFEEERRTAGRGYVAAMEKHLWQRLDRTERISLYDAERVVEAYRTQERAVDPQRIARWLRDAVEGSSRLNVLTRTRVVRVDIAGPTAVRVTVDHTGKQRTESYSAAINALWQNRLAVDETAGIRAPLPVIHRYKVGLHSRRPIHIPGLPNVTFVTGSFGDAVNFGPRVFLSWYPAGHILSCGSLAPPPRPSMLEGTESDLVAARTLEELSRLIPSMREALREPRQEWIVAGGYITAWGHSGIDDPGSRLHERHAIGVTSTGPLHSVDTGKYTTAPLFAHEACGRILKASVAA